MTSNNEILFFSPCLKSNIFISRILVVSVYMGKYVSIVRNDVSNVWGNTPQTFSYVIIKPQNFQTLYFFLRSKVLEIEGKNIK